MANVIVGVFKEAAAAAADAALYPLGVMSAAAEERLDQFLDGATPHRYDTPVVLCHGYGSAKSHWWGVRRALHRAGFSRVTAINYNSLVDDIGGLSARLASVVRSEARRCATGRVHLVGHSMGGVVIHHAVAFRGIADSVGVAATVASPHGGCPAAAIGLGPAAAQMRLGSAFLDRLEAAPTGDVEWVAYAAGFDLVVPPRRAALRLPGATNVTIPDVGHLSVMFDRALAADLARRLASYEDTTTTATPLRRRRIS